MELLSICGGGPPSEGGSLFDCAQNNAAASDDRRELDQAYKDLYKQIHSKVSRMSIQPVASHSEINIPLEGSQTGLAALSMSKNFWMHMR